MHTRKAELQDVSKISDIHVRSWQSVYDGMLPASFLASLDRGEREVMWRSCLQNNGNLFLFEREEQGIIGFLNYAESRDINLVDTIELTAIYLDPFYYSTGAGTIFWTEIECKLRSDSVYAWVLSTNLIGIAFYKKNGFFADGKSKTFEINGQKFEELRYWKDL